MSRWVALISLAIGGVILADIINHGSQTAQAATGISKLTNPVLGALLGQAP